MIVREGRTVLTLVNPTLVNLGFVNTASLQLILNFNILSSFLASSSQLKPNRVGQQISQSSHFNTNCWQCRIRVDDIFYERNSPTCLSMKIRWGKSSFLWIFSGRASLVLNWNRDSSKVRTGGKQVNHSCKEYLIFKISFSDTES